MNICSRDLVDLGSNIWWTAALEGCNTSRRQYLMGIGHQVMQHTLGKRSLQSEQLLTWRAALESGERNFHIFHIFHTINVLAGKIFISQRISIACVAILCLSMLRYLPPCFPFLATFSSTCRFIIVLSFYYQHFHLPSRL